MVTGGRYHGPDVLSILFLVLTHESMYICRYNGGHKWPVWYLAPPTLGFHRNCVTSRRGRGRKKREAAALWNAAGSLNAPKTY